MAEYRKLGKKTKLRKALLRNQVTQLVYKGKIVTTEARAKEVQKIVEPLVTLAAKEKDNFEEVTVKCKGSCRRQEGYCLRRSREEDHEGCTKPPSCKKTDRTRSVSCR